MFNWLKRWWPIFFAVLMCILVWMTGILNYGRTWGAMTDPDDIDEVYFEGEELERSLEKGHEYGVFSYGPGLTLPKGRYRLQWRIAGDGENHLYLRTSNLAPITPDALTITPDVSFDSFWFEVKEPASGLEIQVSFDSGTYIRVDDLRLYSFLYTDHTILFTLLMLFGCMMYVLYQRNYPFRKLAFLLPVLFAVLYASAPMLKDNLTILHDTGFHLPRFYNLAEGIRAGQFPVRMGGFSYNGYGAVTSIFYPDLFLYPGALLLVLGASGQFVMHLYLIACNLISALAMTLLGMRIFKDKWCAAMAGVLYELSLYRLTDILVRCALGEATAMAVLPLFLLGLYELIEGEAKRWPLLALSAASIFLCHLLSTVLCAALALVLLPFLLMKKDRVRRMGAVLLAGSVTVLLCLWALVPMVDMLQMGLGASAIVKEPAVHALEPGVLFTWGSGDQILSAAAQPLSGMPMEPGILLMGACAYLIMLLIRKKDLPQGRGTAVLAMVLGAGALLLSTNLVPWEALTRLSGGRLSYLQFPWRLLMFASVFLSLTAAYAMRQLDKRGDLICMGVLALSVLLALPTTSEQARKSPYIAFGETVDPNTPYEEYLYREMEIQETIHREAAASEGVSIAHAVRSAGRFEADVHADAEGTVLLPLFAFPGYRAELNGQELECSMGEKGRMLVQVPSGSGKLTVQYRGLSRWRLTDVLSVLSAAALGAYVFIRRKKEGKCQKAGKGVH